MAKPRPLHFQLPVGEHHPALLRAVPADLAAGLARACVAPATSSALNVRIVSMVLTPDRADDLIDGDSGLGDQFDQRQQQLPVGFGELLDGWQPRLFSSRLTM